MITQELLDLVLPNTERYTYKLIEGNSIIEYTDHLWQGIIGETNLLGFAFECKAKMATEYGYYLSSGVNCFDKMSKYSKVEYFCRTNNNIEELAATEAEAIIEVCNTLVMKQILLNEKLKEASERLKYVIKLSDISKGEYDSIYKNFVEHDQLVDELKKEKNIDEDIINIDFSVLYACKKLGLNTTIYIEKYIGGQCDA